ncbi:helix-turn-helix domain-containing protein [Ponticaulis sp.]|uniref:helix-turn-helix domain-containing protein n=1 Tax=Ponticaulis sp. TaxID=2020902 RepID=UPI0025E88FFA|nr:helix-turn-helix domain-containing protein [Ponticaulis sp.]
MARRRDYKAEYQRRIARKMAQGFSRSEARGHPRAHEKGIRPKPAKLAPRKEKAIKAMRAGIPLSKAARAFGYSRETLTRYIKRYAGADFSKGRWHFNDERRRTVLILTRGDFLEITVPDHQAAALAGSHYDAAMRATDTPITPEILTPFIGWGVSDVEGRYHALETDLNAILRARNKQAQQFHEVYRIHMS